MTCTKRYQDIPFAHRQPNHDGHCAHIHGHNWAFEFTFSCDRPDVNNFVVDFGKLKWLRSWVDTSFDHALVVPAADPERTIFDTLVARKMAKVLYVPDASSEGLAAYLMGAVNGMLNKLPDMVERGVRCITVTVQEDSRNWAEARGDAW